jgi:hypothetical protein
MKAKYIKNLKNQAQNVTIGKVYVVIGIEADSYRIVCDDGEPYLYDPEQFLLVETQMPDFWFKEKGDDGELYAYPEPWFRSYFFEEYFDNVEGKREVFLETLKKYY